MPINGTLLHSNFQTSLQTALMTAHYISPQGNFETNFYQWETIIIFIETSFILIKRENI